MHWWDVALALSFPAAIPIFVLVASYLSALLLVCVTRLVVAWRVQVGERKGNKCRRYVRSVEVATPGFADEQWGLISTEATEVASSLAPI